MSRFFASVALGAGAAVATLLTAAAAHAGGPLALCREGEPFRWPDGGREIPFNPDQGNLGPLANADAVALVADAFGTWEAVDSATVSYRDAGELSIDVDITNFAPFLEAVEPDGVSAIVFDDTGEIFEALYGPGSGVLGFAGPEFADTETCEILEGLSFLNGPEFTDILFAKAVMVHEFGHYTNLAHTQVNGAAVFGDTNGPTPLDAFPVEPIEGNVETMFPFAVVGGGQETPHADDIAILSRLYPEPDFFATTGAINGTIFAPDGATRLTGVNVIARNVDDPYGDAVSALSSDFSVELAPDGQLTGSYALHGLTPGASYLLYVDEIMQGGFSTSPLQPLPGPEEFYNGASESGDGSVDDPASFELVVPSAGTAVESIDIAFNRPAPGQPLPVGDDGFVELFLPFPVDICGERYQSVFVNSNGSITFGRPDRAFFGAAAQMLAGPPRVAPLWTDLNPAAGGIVTFDESADSFTASWDAVPEFPATGANSFRVTLHRKRGLFGWLFGRTDIGNTITVEYGELSAVRGVAGYSCGGGVASGFEDETDLSAAGRHVVAFGKTAVYEEFVGGEPAGAGDVFDLAGAERTLFGSSRFFDWFELVGDNDTLETATPLILPATTSRVFTSISPAAEDVDHYSIHARAGEFVAVEVVRGTLDSLLGVFDANTGAPLVVDDDGGNGLLSRAIFQVDEDTELVIAVTTFPDFEFVGAGGSGGRYVLHVDRYRGEPLALADDDAAELLLEAFSFPFQGDVYDAVFVGSNGNLTFGEPDPNPVASVAAMLAGAPRIAPLWTDLDPVAGLVLAERVGRDLSIHYVSVPEYATSSANYASVTLSSRGYATVSYGPTARGPALIGVTEGRGAPDPGEANLSRERLRIDGTTYESFERGVRTSSFSDFDLLFRRLSFR
jgi:hypothetical protein